MLFNKSRHNINKNIKNVFIYAFSVFLIVLPARALASTYGSGNYGACKYSQGCSSSSTGTSPSAPLTAQPASIVLLNDYSQFFTDQGVTLTLKVGQIVYYELTINGVTQRFSITVKQIGANFVVLTFSPNAKDYTLYLNSTMAFDANGDGKNDIQIRLDSLTQDQVSLNFKALSSEPKTIPKAAPTALAATPHHNHWLLIISLILIIVGLLIFILLFFKRRRKKDQNLPPPAQIVTPGQ